MTLLDQLKNKCNKVLDDKVIEFAEIMEEVIIQSAEKGYKSYTFQIHPGNPDKHIMCSNKFAEKVEELMDGVKVKYVAVTTQSSLLTFVKWIDHYITFEWGT